MGEREDIAAVLVRMPADLLARIDAHREQVRQQTGGDTTRTSLIVYALTRWLASVEQERQPEAPVEAPSVAVSIPPAPLAPPMPDMPEPAMDAVTATRNSSVTDTSTPKQTPAAPLRRGQAKLTPRQVKALRAKRARGVPVKALMDEYGVSKATVFRYLAQTQPA